MSAHKYYGIIGLSNTWVIISVQMCHSTWAGRCTGVQLCTYLVGLLLLLLLLSDLIRLALNHKTRRVPGKAREVAR